MDKILQKPRFHVLDDPRAQPVIPQHPVFVQGCRAAFKLRLHQDSQVSDSEPLQQRLQDRFRRDEGYIHAQKLRNIRKVLWLQIPGIDAFHLHHPRIPVQFVRQLQVSHIHGIDFRSPMLQADIGESASAGPDVQHRLSLQINAAHIHRLFQFGPCTGDEICFSRQYGDLFRIGYIQTGLAHRFAVHLDPACTNGILCLRTGAHGFCQQPVQSHDRLPFPEEGPGSPLDGRTPASTRRVPSAWRLSVPDFRSIQSKRSSRDMPSSLRSARTLP